MGAIFSSLIVGMILGAGFALSQMMNPAKVLAFFDFAGNWDPTLAFVMGGALIAAVPGFLFAKKRAAPALGGTFQVPTRRDIQEKLFEDQISVLARRYMRDLRRNADIETR